MDHFHATAVAYCGSGILIRGPSGSGKSDLALRLIDDDADLIADDRVVIKVVEKELRLSPPESISGLIEVRGIGVVKIETVQDIPLCLVVELEPSYQTQRMPEIKEELIKDVSVPIININSFESSALVKIKIVLRYLEKKIELIS